MAMNHQGSLSLFSSFLLRISSSHSRTVPLEQFLSKTQAKLNYRAQSLVSSRYKRSSVKYCLSFISGWKRRAGIECELIHTVSVSFKIILIPAFQRKERTYSSFYSISKREANEQTEEGRCAAHFQCASRRQLQEAVTSRIIREVSTIFFSKMSARS